MKRPTRVPISWIVLGAVLLGAGSARPAAAATLLTAPLPLRLDGGTGVCLLVNVGSKTATARLRAYNEAASLAADSGDVSIQPKQIAKVIVDVGMDGGTEIHCRFDVDSAKARVRASGCIMNAADRITCLEGH